MDRRGRGVAAAAGAILGIALIAFCPSAWALGDDALDELILGNPGTDPLPDSRLEQVVKTEKQVISSVTNGAVNVAANGWEESSDRSVLIVLIAVEKKVPRPAREAKAGVLSVCAGAGAQPSSTAAVQEIPTSAEAVCSAKGPDGERYELTSIAWVRHNVLALVVGTNYPASRVESVAVQQDRLIPSEGVATESDSTTTILIIVGVVAACAIASLVLVLRRRRRAASEITAGLPITRVSVYQDEERDLERRLTDSLGTESPDGGSSASDS